MERTREALQGLVEGRLGVKPNFTQIAAAFNGGKKLRAETAIELSDDQLEQGMTQMMTILGVAQPSTGAPASAEQLAKVGKGPENQPSNSAEAGASAPAQAQPQIEKAIRERTPADDQWLGWIHSAVQHEAAILAGTVLLEDFEVWFDQLRLPDPFEKHLEGRYPADKPGARFVYFNRAEMLEAQAAGLPNPHHSDTLTGVMMEGLGALWLAPQHCQTCKGDISSPVGFSMIERVLDGRIKLPEADPSVRSALRPLRDAYEKRCIICHSVLKELLRRDKERQKLPPEKRSAEETQDLIATIVTVHDKLKRRGVSMVQVKACTRAVLREQKAQSKTRPRSK